MRWALIMFFAGCAEPPPDPATAESPRSDEAVFSEGTLAQVVRVTDGDTIRVRFAGEEERVRYIGVDTPETEHSPRGAQPYGAEASEANRRLVEGRNVRLVFDVEQRDRYRRLLAYVYLEDGTFVNARLVEQGFARRLTVPPNVRYAEEFGRLERQARSERRGLWALDD